MVSKMKKKKEYKACKCGQRIRTRYNICSTCRAVKAHERRYLERLASGKILKAAIR